MAYARFQFKTDTVTDPQYYLIDSFGDWGQFVITDKLPHFQKWVGKPEESLFIEALPFSDMAPLILTREELTVTENGLLFPPYPEMHYKSVITSRDENISDTELYNSGGHCMWEIIRTDKTTWIYFRDTSFELFRFNDSHEVNKQPLYEVADFYLSVEIYKETPETGAPSNPVESKRYLKLQSVGSAIDLYTLRTFPLLSNDNISFEDGMDIEDVGNPDWWDGMSIEDAKLLVKCLQRSETKIRYLIDRLPKEAFWN